MNKILKLLAASAALMVTPAFAQSGGVMESVSGAEVTSMLTEFGISSQLQTPPNGGSPVLVAGFPSGAKFLVSFFECADAVKPAGCKQVMISTAMAGGGAAFEDLNTFNGQSSVTTVVYEPTNQILIFGRNVFIPGGVGRENFKLQIALFLNDMQTYVQGMRSSAKSVSFMETPKLKSKITSMTAAEAADKPVVAAALSGAEDRSLEVEMAIANTIDADFSLTARE